LHWKRHWFKKFKKETLLAMKKKRATIRAKIVKPVRLSPAGRKQMGITPRIRKYVAGFKAKSKIELAKKIVADIASFKKVALPIEEAKSKWAKRSADGVIKTRNIYTMIAKEAVKTRKPSILGCSDYAEAVTSCLRAAGFQALILRMGTHTKTKFLYRKQVWFADATDNRRAKVRQMDTADKRVEEVLRKKGKYAEGASLAQIGIKSYDDFRKYY